MQSFDTNTTDSERSFRPKSTRSDSEFWEELGISSASSTVTESIDSSSSDRLSIMLLERGSLHGNKSSMHGSMNSISRPSLLDLGSNAMDIKAEVDYIPSRTVRSPRASEHAIETTERVHRKAHTDAAVEGEMTSSVANPINSHDSVERREHLLV